MIRVLITAVEILFCFLLQSSVFPKIALANVVPDLLMILVVTVAFTRGVFPGMFTGLAAGLLVDCCLGDVIGLYGILYMFIGFVNGYTNRFYDSDDYIMPVALIGISELVFSFFYYIFEFLLRGRLNIGYYAYRLMLPKVVYTVVMGVFFYKLFHSIHKGLLAPRKKED